jgi:hypothetical protein
MNILTVTRSSKSRFYSVSTFNQRLKTAAQKGSPSSDLRTESTEVHKILEEMTANNLRFDDETTKIVTDIGNGAYDPLTLRSRARAAFFDAERIKFEKAHPSSFENRS